MSEGEATDFLYPMVDQAGEVDVQALLADLGRSAVAKAADSARITATALRDHDRVLKQAAQDVAARLLAGGRILTCGNGGSATDADGVAGLFTDPPQPPALPARSLVADVSVLTALANDIGFDQVFARQLHAHARPADVLIALSTSGNSPNLLCAAEAARRLGVLTVGISGDRGGRMADDGRFDHLLVVGTSSIHRIQEAQSRLAFELWRRVARRLELTPGGPFPAEGGHT